MYTFIFMSSRKNSVRQFAINRGHVSFFLALIFVLFLAPIAGLSYGRFQKQQRTLFEQQLQANTTKEIEQITEEKRQAELALADVKKEMKSIRRVAENIREALGILGQGGGDSRITWIPEVPEEQVDPQQEDTSVSPETSAPEAPAPLTPSILKAEIQSVYDYISEYQNQVDEYPSILPVKLQQESGEKYAFWYSSGFGWRTHPFTGKREFHQGLDIKTRLGLPVIAAANGVVSQIEQNGYFGKTVEIDHEAPQFKTLYAHLDNYADKLRVGQNVTRGQIIGYVGNTGRSTGPHLHYGIYDKRKELWVNPYAYIFDLKPTLSP